MNTSGYDPQADFETLLMTLMNMVDAQAGLPIAGGQEWMQDRQTLARKFVHHLVSIGSINAGGSLLINDQYAPYVDHGSVNVLLRAVVENFIVFVIVYGHEDEQTCRFRHTAWKVSGLNDRQRRFAKAQELLEKLAEEKKQMEALVEQVRQFPQFLAMSEGRQTAFLKNKDWGFGRKWPELAEEVGFHPAYFRNVYYFFCDYSHSSWNAAMQIGQATPEDQRAMATSMLGVANFCMAHFIKLYKTLFPAAEAVFAQSTSSAAYDRWSYVRDAHDAHYAGDLSASH